MTRSTGTSMQAKKPIGISRTLANEYYASLAPKKRTPEVKANLDFVETSFEVAGFVKFLWKDGKPVAKIAKMLRISHRRAHRIVTGETHVGAPALKPPKGRCRE